MSDEFRSGCLLGAALVLIGIWWGAMVALAWSWMVAKSKGKGDDDGGRGDSGEAGIQDQ